MDVFSCRAFRAERVLRLLRSAFGGHWQHQVLRRGEDMKDSGERPIQDDRRGAAGVITAAGGNGGAGGTPAGGNRGGGAGGGAGGGGFIYLLYRTLTNNGSITVAGGTGGTKGLKTGTGTDGADGANGSAGTLLKYNLSVGAFA